MEADSSTAGRTTRSQAQAAPAPAAPPASTSHKREVIHLDSDDDQDEDEPFEYESDVDSPKLDPVAMEVDSDAGQAADDDGEEDCIVLSSDVEVDDEQPQTPPEPVVASKGRPSSRKQFQADIAHLAERFSGGASEIVTGTRCSSRSFGAHGSESSLVTLLHYSLRQGRRRAGALHAPARRFHEGTPSRRHVPRRRGLPHFAPVHLLLGE